MEFFRFCPNCGRRFQIKLLRKQVVRMERLERRRTRSFGLGAGSPADPYFGVPRLTVVHEGVPIIVDIEEFQYNYKCKHCGHEWSEKRVQEHKER